MRWVRGRESNVREDCLRVGVFKIERKKRHQHKRAWEKGGEWEWTWTAEKRLIAYTHDSHVGGSEQGDKYDIAGPKGL